MNSLEALFPEALFIVTDSPHLGFHACPDFDGDDHRSTASISYHRFGGSHRIEACGLCLGSELAYLHLGNPKPRFVTVAQFDETEVAA